MKFSVSKFGNRALGRSELFLKKHGPEILVGAGIAGFGVTAYLVGKATLKAQEPLKELRVEMDQIRSKEIHENYTEKERYQEAGRTFILGYTRIARIYAPAAVVGIASTACVLTAHGMMRRQQAGLVAAYTALDQGFRAYRRRVAELIGEEKERELYRRPPRKIESTDDAGTPCEIDDPSDIMPSPYARWFEPTNPNWRNRNDYNLIYLRSIQLWANDRLTARGILFLNEVYEELGLEWDQAGQEVGWKLDGKWKRSSGDGFVDFGLPDIDDPRQRAFIDGVGDALLIDFNVDGPIKIG